MLGIYLFFEAIKHSGHRQPAYLSRISDNAVAVSSISKHQHFSFFASQENSFLQDSQSEISKEFSADFLVQSNDIKYKNSTDFFSIYTSKICAAKSGFNYQAHEKLLIACFAES